MRVLGFLIIWMILLPATGILADQPLYRNLLSAVKSGQVPMALLNDKVRRIIRLYIRCALARPRAWCR